MQSNAGVEHRYLQSDSVSPTLSSLSRETLGKFALSKGDRRKNIWDIGEISLLGGVQKFESLETPRTWSSEVQAQIQMVPAPEEKGRDWFALGLCFVQAGKFIHCVRVGLHSSVYCFTRQF